MKEHIFSEKELKDLIVENQITDKDIQQILKNQKFKQAINNIFGTIDLNKLQSIGQGVIQIKKYVDTIYKNTVEKGNEI